MKRSREEQSLEERRMNGTQGVDVVLRATNIELM